MNSCLNKITLNGVKKSFGETEILRNFDLQLNEDEFVSMVGPSGCGKSTIFNLITGLLSPDEGVIDVNGKYSYMYQKDLLLPYKTIIDNVSLPLVLNKIPKREAREAVKDYFPIFGIEGYEHKYPSELSGGMKQRANFLRTFVSSSDIMLLDEPFGALDSITKSSMQKWLMGVKKEINASILLITHDIEEAILLSDRIYLLSDKPTYTKEVFDLKKMGLDKSSVEQTAILKAKIIELM